MGDNPAVAEPAPQVVEFYQRHVAALSDDNPADRATGLRGLEQLGQANPEHRQAVVNPICAYLRRPFDPPRGRPTPTVRQELRVRLTAQQILTTHLRTRTGLEAFWPGIDLDLSTAALVNFDLHGCRANRVKFAKAMFTGATDIRAASFAEANFCSAFFSENVTFSGVTFTGECRFTETLFAGSASFDNATFDGPAVFEGTKFYGPARFADSVYRGPAVFDNAYFVNGPIFPRAAFEQESYFNNVRFDSDAQFKGITFAGSATFNGCIFNSGVTFRTSTFERPSHFRNIQFSGSVDLAEVGEIDLSGAHATDNSYLRRRWPAGWAAVRTRQGRLLTLMKAGPAPQA